MINTINNNRIEDENEIHFLTLHVVEWMDVFSKKRYKDIFLNNLIRYQDDEHLEIYAWCLMTDHVHLIVRASEENTLTEVIELFKKDCQKQIVKDILTSSTEKRQKWMLSMMMAAAKKNKRTSFYQLWEIPNNPILIEETSDFNQMLNVMHEKPVEAGIVDNSEEYIYSSARNFNDSEGLIDLNFY